MAETMLLYSCRYIYPKDKDLKLVKLVKNRATVGVFFFFVRPVQRLS